MYPNTFKLAGLVFAILALASQSALAMPSAFNQQPAQLATQLAKRNNAYTGASGSATGGSVSEHENETPDLLDDLGVDLFSGNAGEGGETMSGSANSNKNNGGKPSHRGGNGSAYSGAAGDASGGSVVNTGPKLLRLFSDNGGDGGSSISGQSQTRRSIAGRIMVGNN
ncbi:hypothetical protein FISHEDRAFT_71014 [Fistulina hepatica ATCC 64428]|uniref:Uncharacterized protein n=1 Tax=Fistulina hepatica ATCC 64428 TaxID=1128425 RepID=A0A0D7AHP6_9AGAR|nr:hypothetical protein FISHEDRAFT_71014 [Fistulina hepatica ATCC 64428]